MKRRLLLDALAFVAIASLLTGCAYLTAHQWYPSPENCAPLTLSPAHERACQQAAENAYRAGAEAAR